MDIPMRGTIEATEPWTFAMAFAEQAQLAEKVSGLLASVNVESGVLAVDVDNQAVNVDITYNGEQQTVSVPGWRRSGTLTPYPADYVSDRVQYFLGIQ